MGEPLNASSDLIPANDMYDACRIIGPRVRHTGDNTWDFSDVLSGKIDARFEVLVRSYLASVLSSDAEWRGWKLPETTLAFPWIARMFPDAYYISWVRDPRDSVLGSHLTDDLADFGVSYEPTDDERRRRSISWIYQRAIVAATPKPSRWIEVRFEDFVLEQEATLTRLEGYLGFPLARIPVDPVAVGRWRRDPDFRADPIVAGELASLGYNT
jgi:hypothetical protein